MSRNPLPPSYAAYGERIRVAGKVTSLWPMIQVGIGVTLGFVVLPDWIATIILGQDALEGFRTGSTPIGLILHLLSFGVPLAVLAIMVKRIHRRDLTTATGAPAPAIQGMVAAFLSVLFVLAFLEILPPWPGSGEIAEVRPFWLWALALGPGLAALAVQVTAEEAFFRGYLQQNLAAFSKNPIVWIWVPSLVFGGIHFFNGGGAADGALWALFATLLGLACADLTARHGTIGPAIGLHLANNVFAYFILGMQGAPQSGLALYLMHYRDPSLYGVDWRQLFQPWAVYEALILSMFVFCLWLAARVGIRR